MDGNELYQLLHRVREQTDIMDKSHCGKSKPWDPLEWHFYNLRESSRDTLEKLAEKHSERR